MNQRDKSAGDVTEVIAPQSDYASGVLAKISEVMQKRAEFREQLMSRARIVERDIEAWAMEWVQHAWQDPTVHIEMRPPESMFSVEPPF